MVTGRIVYPDLGRPNFFMAVHYHNLQRHRAREDHPKIDLVEIIMLHVDLATSRSIE